MQLKCHPDKFKSIAANRMSQEVNRAYQVLGDPERRSVYDRLGEDGVRKTNPENDDEESRNERDEQGSSEGKTNNKQRERANGDADPDASKKRTENKRDENFYQETNNNFSFYICKYSILSLSVIYLKNL